MYIYIFIYVSIYYIYIMDTDAGNPLLTEYICTYIFIYVSIYIYILWMQLRRTWLADIRKCVENTKLSTNKQHSLSTTNHAQMRRTPY